MGNMTAIASANASANASASVIADAADTADVHPNLWTGNLRGHLRNGR
jgi:hypothetical protein